MILLRVQGLRAKELSAMTSLLQTVRMSFCRWVVLDYASCCGMLHVFIVG